MSLTAIDMLGASAGPNAVGERIAEWCQPYPAKVLARMIEVEPRTAKSWKAGSLPQMRHLTAMVERWGVEFLEYVFAPVLLDRMPLDQRLERLEREIGAIRSEIRDAKAAVPADPVAGAAASAAGRAGGAGRATAPGARAGSRSLAAAAARGGRALLAILVLAGLIGAGDDVMARTVRRVDARPPLVRVARAGGGRW